MKRILCAAIALSLSLLSACGLSRSHVTVWRAVSPYYFEGGKAAVDTENVKVDSALGQIDAAMYAFNSHSNDPALSRALPDGVNVLDWELHGSELRLNVSPGYAELAGYDRAVADCCATLTFCAIDGIESVSIYSGGAMLTSARTPGGIMLADTTGTE